MRGAAGGQVPVAVAVAAAVPPEVPVARSGCPARVRSGCPVSVSARSELPCPGGGNK